MRYIDEEVGNEWHTPPPYIYFISYSYKLMTPEEEAVVAPVVEEEAVAEEVAVEEVAAEEEVAEEAEAVEEEAVEEAAE